MKSGHIKRSYINPAFFSGFLICMVLFLCNSCYAGKIVITGNQIINKPTTYNNVVIDMTNGRFTIQKGGSLDIENSTINATISPDNPFAMLLLNGGLTLKNNTVNVSVSGIVPNPNAKSLYQLLQIQQGSMDIESNVFSIDTPYALSFLETQFLETNGFIISNNQIKNFHGGISLVFSNDAVVNDNIFENVSFSNIFNIGNSTRIQRNIFTFPGNLVLGDAIDVINSSNLTITDNIIASSAGYGIYINGGENITIDSNKITDGLTFGIFIDSPAISLAKKHKYLVQLLPKKKLSPTKNSFIVIKSNYIAQNKYGLSGGVVDDLTVTNNFFIQRFTDSATRQLWTNNNVLLPSVTNLTWNGNLYKEAFTQEVPGDNTSTLQFVTFPQSGGVVLP